MTNGIIQEKIAKIYKDLLRDKRLSKDAKGIAGVYFAEVEQAQIEEIKKQKDLRNSVPLEVLIGDQN